MIAVEMAFRMQTSPGNLLDTRSTRENDDGDFPPILNAVIDHWR